MISCNRQGALYALEGLRSTLAGITGLLQVAPSPVKLTRAALEGARSALHEIRSTVYGITSTGKNDISPGKSTRASDIRLQRSYVGLPKGPTFNGGTNSPYTRDKLAPIVAAALEYCLENRSSYERCRLAAGTICSTLLSVPIVRETGYATVSNPSALSYSEASA